MDLYTAISERRTIRDFLDKEVDSGTVQRILTAGLKAPTNDHMRNWEFIVITEKEEKARVIEKIREPKSDEKIAELLDSWHMTDQRRRDMYMDAISKQYSMLYYGSCLILPLFKQKHPLLKPESLSSLNNFASIWCCIENIFLAATAEGLAAAFRIPMENELVYLKELLNYPDNYYIPCYISIGYPAGDAIITRQHLFDAKDKIHINRW